MRSSRSFATELCVLGLSATFFWLGCDTAPPANMSPASRPAMSQPTAPATARPSVAKPPLPEYLTVTTRVWPERPPRVLARVEPGNRLIVDTQNVRRLRIARDRLPLDSERRIVLQLDTQGIEWTAGSQVVEFERSDNGVWSPVQPTKPSAP